MVNLNLVAVHQVRHLIGQTDEIKVERLLAPNPTASRLLHASRGARHCIHSSSPPRLEYLSPTCILNLDISRRR
jgi:hypothetical protein